MHSVILSEVEAVTQAEGQAGLSIPLPKLQAAATGSCRSAQDDLPVVVVNVA